MSREQTFLSQMHFNYEAIRSLARLFKYDSLRPSHRYLKNISGDYIMQLGLGWSEVVLKLSPDCSISSTC